VRHLPPIRWADVTPGMVVIGQKRIPHAVIDIYPAALPGYRVVLLEGLPPGTYHDADCVGVVELDRSDAIGTLHASGLNPTPIEGAS
jgi:hypothetical protein